MQLCILKSTVLLAAEPRKEDQSKKFLPWYAVKLPKRTGLHLSPPLAHFSLVNKSEVLMCNCLVGYMAPVVHLQRRHNYMMIAYVDHLQFRDGHVNSCGQDCTKRCIYKCRHPNAPESYNLHHHVITVKTQALIVSKPSTHTSRKMPTI